MNTFIFFFKFIQYCINILQKYVYKLLYEENIIKNKIENKTEKYEDKYLEAFKKIKNNFILTEDEIELKKTKTIEYLNLGDEEAERKATEYVWNKRCENLKNNYVMEYTPLGNVIMYYDHFKNSFMYYSDHTLPYRFLEVVARKYVITFRCPKLYVSMEDVIKEAEEKLLREKEEKEEKEKEKEEKYKEEINKKNVFARFKNYNKPGGQSIVETTPKIQKNNIKNNLNTQKILLKENANRYTHGGRFLDFNILQKVDRKINDKRLAMSFADFKKNNLKK